MRLHSKWGQGHLYEHGVWEVPKRYGHEVRFYQAIDAAAAWQAFHRFVEAHPAWGAFAQAADIANLIANGSSA